MPIFGGSALLQYVESSHNTKLRDYGSNLVFIYKAITNADVTDATVITNDGKIIIGVFALLNLVFFGFIAAIITTSVEIMIAKQKIK